MTTDPPLTDPAELRRTILALAAERGPEKSICPSEVARALAGSDEKRWRLLMTPIRREAVRLASEGRVAILRKNRPVDPTNFKGIYRLRAVSAEAIMPSDAEGPGNSSGVRPVHQ